MLTLDPETSIFGSEGNPLDYPGALKDRPYLLLGKDAHELRGESVEALRLRSTGEGVDAVLRRRGSAGLSDRVVSVAFGANRDLRNLAWKFAHYHDETGRRPSGDLVVLPVAVEDADVVACNVGYWGCVYGALLLHRPAVLRRDYLAGVRTPVALLLVDEDQLHMLHASEGVPRRAGAERAGVSCDVALLDVVFGTETLTAQLYVLALPFLSLDGELPVPLAESASACRPETLRPLRQEELWAAVWDRLGLGSRYELSWAEAVVRLQRSVRARRAGRPGDSEAELLYDEIRSGIAERLALRDADGRIRTAIDDMPKLLPPDEAWSFEHGRFGRR